MAKREKRIEKSIESLKNQIESHFERLEQEIKENGIKIRKEQNPEEFLKEFLSFPKPKKNLTLKDIRKIEDESYDLP